MGVLATHLGERMRGKLSKVADIRLPGVHVLYG